MHIKQCRRCKKIYRTCGKHSKYCDDCWKPTGGKKPCGKNTIRMILKNAKNVD